MCSLYKKQFFNEKLRIKHRDFSHSESFDKTLYILNMVLNDDEWYKEFIRQMKFDILNEIGVEGPTNCLWDRKFSVCVQDVGAALRMTAS